MSHFHLPQSVRPTLDMRECNRDKLCIVRMQFPCDCAEYSICSCSEPAPSTCNQNSAIASPHNERIGKGELFEHCSHKNATASAYL